MNDTPAYFCDADRLRHEPSDELAGFAAIAQEHSAASQSTVRKDFDCEDGSMLTVQSHAGGEVEWLVQPPAPRPPDEGPDPLSPEA